MLCMEVEVQFWLLSGTCSRSFSDESISMFFDGFDSLPEPSGDVALDHAQPMKSKNRVWAAAVALDFIFRGFLLLSMNVFCLGERTWKRKKLATTW